MSINKNFTVKNGIEVNNNLIFADSSTQKVGIGTSTPNYKLDVAGSLSATDVVANSLDVNDLNVNGNLTIDNSNGGEGYYLVATGAGVSWRQPPSLRSIEAQIAAIGQTAFVVPFTYTPGLVDVYINGVKLQGNGSNFNDSEYLAVGTGVTSNAVYLKDPCFGGEVVEIVGYAAFGVGAGGSGISGISIKKDNVFYGNPLNVVSLDFFGGGVNVQSGVGAAVSITVKDENWDKVSIGLTVGVTTTAKVGIGTSVPRYNLDVEGDINFTGAVYEDGSPFIASRWTTGAGTSIYRNSRIGIGTTNPTQDLDVAGDVRVRGSIYDRFNATGSASRLLSHDGTGIQWIASNVLAQGLQGPQGLQGIQGVQGVQGLNGIFAGQGLQGLQGLQGSQGLQGIQGIQGLQGIQGPQGLQGIQGIQGLQGIQGIQGLRGLQGLQGIQGDQGIQGLRGIQGLQGIQGVQGPQGLQGIQGPQGLQGIQGDQGLQGIQGIQGLQGIQGIQGIQGPQGLQGIQGDQGLQGIQGIQGIQGVQSVQGPQGPQGLQGVQGPQGVQGLIGNASPRGFSIEYPETGDSFTLFRTVESTSIQSAIGVLRGSSSPQVSFSLRYASDRSTAGNVGIATTTVSNVGIGSTLIIVNQPIPINNWVWINVNSVSGIVTEFSVSMQL